MEYRAYPWNAALRYSPIKTKISPSSRYRNIPSPKIHRILRCESQPNRQAMAETIIENPIEMAGTRLGVVARVKNAHAPAYEAVFGPLPSTNLPISGKPGDAMTTQLLDAMTHGTGGTWSMRRGAEKTETPLAEFTVGAAKGHLPVPVKST